MHLRVFFIYLQFDTFRTFRSEETSGIESRQISRQAITKQCSWIRFGCQKTTHFKETSSNSEASKYVRILKIECKRKKKEEYWQVSIRKMKKKKKKKKARKRNNYKDFFPRQVTFIIHRIRRGRQCWFNDPLITVWKSTTLFKQLTTPMREIDTVSHEK